ncbi:MAG: hypothetical protein KDC84_14950 [Crocinitomicaceae bacterium]|nr:hypothetical protein [Crocinitomicaceae bacterium]
MIASETQIESILLSGPLQNIRVFQVNDDGHQNQEVGYFLVDGGIELQFPGGVFSACWKGEEELFAIEDDHFEKVYGQTNFFELHNSNTAKLDAFKGLKVVSHKIQKEEFEFIADFTMNTERAEKIVGVDLEFENERSLELAFVDYHLDKNGVPGEFWYDLTMELLIAVDLKVEIRD